MPHLSELALSQGKSPAVIEVDSGRVTDYATLEGLTNQTARMLIAKGIQPGGNLAICLPNGLDLVVLILAAQRTGAYYTLIPTQSSLRDISYFVEDSGASLLVVADGAIDQAALRTAIAPQVSVVALTPSGDASLRVLIAGYAPLPAASFAAGTEMNYSSGSTGRPKGVRRPLPERAWNLADPRNVGAGKGWSIDQHAVVLNTSPLYHAAPHRFLCASIESGACMVLMRKFDALTALTAIDQYRCTHSLWVPTMFQRLLALPAEQRQSFDVSSMRFAVHGAAPCPIPIKEAMIDWWGPVLLEYYSGTEGVGTTQITSQEWLAHKGSVGKPVMSVVHVLDAEEKELPTGTEGTIYFESAATFSYWKAEEKTRTSISHQGWKTFGDLGYLDADGYLYLTGRNNFTINSGGVNLYPQEMEDALLATPGVYDAVVISVPDQDFGERAVALVQLEPGETSPAQRLDAIIGHVRQELGPIKTPKSFCIVQSTERTDSGKLKRKEIRQAYLDGRLTVVDPVH